MEVKTIHELVRQMEQDDTQGNTHISKYVDFSMRETLEKISAYLNSKHTSGETDSLGREKPFFNIVTAAVNIWYRATDIDRKNIHVKATKEKDEINSFIATIILQEWMRKTAFGRFLNEWGRVLARYGSAVIKFIEKDGELHTDVISWDSLLCDAIDFNNNIKVERLWFTPAQLKKQPYDQKLVDKLLDNITSRTTMGGQKKDNKNDYICLYEVHGELPLSLLTDKEKDEETYVQQMHVVTFIEKKDGSGFDDYTLISGREKQDPYMITHLIKEDGRTLSIGAVEHLFEAQWMVNHSQKQIKDQLDLASKLFFQTSDGNFVGQNALTNLENGDILIWDAKSGSGLTQLNNKPDIVAMQSFKNDWQAVGNQINGISEAMMGANPPSDTAWRLQQAVLQESHSLFELMTENKGLAIEDMMTKYIIPHLKKKMDTAEEISAILEDHQIKQIDSRFVPNEAIRRINKRVKETILSGQIVNPQEMAMELETEKVNLQRGLDQQGKQRFIKPSEIATKTWKEVLKDLEWEVIVDITGEQVDNQEAMATYQTALQFIMGLQGRPMTPDEQLLFNKLISRTGDISPLELNKSNPVQPAATPVAPVALSMQNVPV